MIPAGSDDLWSVVDAYARAFSFHTPDADQSHADSFDVFPFVIIHPLAIPAIEFRITIHFLYPGACITGDIFCSCSDDPHIATFGLKPTGHSLLPVLAFDVRPITKHLAASAFNQIVRGFSQDAVTEAVAL